jgi:peptidyl-prolyl cis-trans isomerase D
MALKWLRDNLKHLKFVLWGVVVVFVLLVFVDWGSGRGGGTRDTGSFAVRVGGSGLTEGEFLRRLSVKDEQYRRAFGDQWDQYRRQLDLPSQVINEYVNMELLAQEADRIGLVVTDEELRDVILADFEVDGTYVGNDRYEAIVRRSMRMTPRDYEEMRRKDLLVNKLRDLTLRSVYVSDAEAEEEYRRRNEKASFDAIKLTSSSFLSDVEIDDSEVQTYYDEHQTELTRDEQRSIRYLLIDTGRLRRLLEVDQVEIEEYYQSHSNEFVEGEKVHARHVLIRLDPNANQSDKAEAELRADSVAEMARQGADFTELASKHSDDPGSKDQGGDLDWFGRGQMVSAFEEAAFGAKPGEIIGPVKSEYGYHIIKIEGYRPESQKPLDEVRDEVRISIVEGRAAAEAEVRATALEARLQGALVEAEPGDEIWQQIADEDEAVALNVSPAFGRDEVIPGIGNDPELSTEVFAAEAAVLGGKKAVARGWIVWQVKEIRPAGVPPLEEVRAEVERQVRQAKALDQASTRAEQLLTEWTADSDTDALAATVGGTVARAEDHTRGTNVRDLGIAPALDDAVFAAAAGDVVGPVKVGDQGVAIARVGSLQLVTDEDLVSNLETSRTQLVQQRADQLLSSVIGELRRDTEIAWDTELMERFRPKE